MAPFFFVKKSCDVYVGGCSRAAPAMATSIKRQSIK